MSEMKIEVPTEFSSLGEARETLDRGISEMFPGGMLQSRWEGETLHLTGAGAVAEVTLEDGHLVARATLKPPASLMRGMIEEKVAGFLRKVAPRTPDV
jgi:hypothetical protein